MVPEPVRRYLEAHNLGQPAQSEPASGGCINQGRVLTTTSGARFFLKTNPQAPPDMFAREAEGLAALAAAPGGPRVPGALLEAAGFLLLEYLAPAPAEADYWPALGRRLARQHLVTQDRFGFDHHNYLGLTPQPNPWSPDGHQFFAEHRLGYLGRLCAGRGLLDRQALRHVEHLSARLPGLIPAQPASLLHGDPWSGNIIPGPEGQACVIDPAAHYGWAEADLAMLTLFGQPPAAFYRAYESVRPLAQGYRERFDLYNLYHLLNHLWLFGRAYGQAVDHILRRYG